MIGDIIMVCVWIVIIGWGKVVLYVLMVICEVFGFKVILFIGCGFMIDGDEVLFVCVFGMEVEMIGGMMIFK